MQTPVRFLPPTAFELLMMVLSIVSLVAIVLHQFGPFNAAEKELLLYLDTSICVILLSHFFYGLFTAHDKKRFLKVHWIDFIASIPAIDVLRYGRIFQVLRVLRMLRVANQVIRHLLRNSGSTMMATMLLILVVVISGSAIAILMTEAGNPDSNIETAEDALWWALVTISTVGYGDYYPVTTAGRVISSVVIFAGVSLFAGISGLVASAVLSPKAEEQQEAVEHAVETEEQEVNQQLNALRAEVASLREEIISLKTVLGENRL
ncbi:ion transporter [Oceanimonas sp. CHS3-5]|uniref:ion transporter n=1 Tax=Oceanimonas sp. CHS3-5 TaxID=3068186 RepID=UPI00273D5FAD|nr:ion transporter [Oceanimonas sp. CHS3-5]MDP5292873.1 ion transporter [Oceanimonas sp. CHS3-5]